MAHGCKCLLIRHFKDPLYLILGITEIGYIMDSVTDRNTFLCQADVRIKNPPVGAGAPWDPSALLPEDANETGEGCPFSSKLKAAGAPSPAIVDNPAIFKNCLLLISIRTSP
jgi:hypothetical protein